MTSKTLTHSINMKLLFSIIFYLIINATLFSQSKEAFKKANTIILNMESDEKSNYSSFGRHLISEGYSLTNTSKDFLSFETNNRHANSPYYKLFVSCVDNQIVIKVKWNVETLGLNSDEMFEWEWAKSAMNRQHSIWIFFLPHLKSFTENIEYDRI